MRRSFSVRCHFSSRSATRPDRMCMSTRTLLAFPFLTHTLPHARHRSLIRLLCSPSYLAPYPSLFYAIYSTNVPRTYSLSRNALFNRISVRSLCSTALPPYTIPISRVTPAQRRTDPQSTGTPLHTRLATFLSYVSTQRGMYRLTERLTRSAYVRFSTFERNTPHAQFECH